MEKSHLQQNGKAEALMFEEVPAASQQISVVSEEDDPRLRRVKWKVDLRLSVILALMYIVNQIDRTNLPNA